MLLWLETGFCPSSLNVMFDTFLVSCLLITIIRPWKYIKENCTKQKNISRTVPFMNHPALCLTLFSVQNYKVLKNSSSIWSGSCCVKVVTLLYSILCSVQLETSLSVSLFPQQLALRQLGRGSLHEWINVQILGTAINEKHASQADNILPCGWRLGTKFSLDVTTRPGQWGQVAGADSVFWLTSANDKPRSSLRAGKPFPAAEAGHYAGVWYWELWRDTLLWSQGDTSAIPAPGGAMSPPANQRPELVTTDQWEAGSVSPLRGPEHPELQPAYKVKWGLSGAVITRTQWGFC